MASQPIPSSSKKPSDGFLSTSFSNRMSSSPAGSFGTPAIPNIPPLRSPNTLNPSASANSSSFSIAPLPKQAIAGAASASTSNLGKSKPTTPPISGLNTPPTPAVANGGGAGGSDQLDPASISGFDLTSVSPSEKARVLAKHLVSTQERRASNAVAGDGHFSKPSSLYNESGISSAGSRAVADDEDFEIPFATAGSDITHDLYKWAQTHTPSTSASNTPNPVGILRKARSASFSHGTRTGTETYSAIKEPGGFRRQFISARARERGEESPRVLRNLVDFLFLYGHFAGEDLEEEDEEEEETLPTSTRREPTEQTPLIASSQQSRARSASRKRGMSVGLHGTATVTEATLMLLKGFVGTGVLFLGKAFYNGGIVFSTVTLLAIAGISLWSFLLLVKTRLTVPGSYGDIGGALYGQYMRTTILASIAISQIGFVAAYSIFVAENLQAFIKGVTGGNTTVEVKWLIAAQVVIFLPLSLIRNLAKLSGTALIADAFILIGLIYIAYNEVGVIASEGIAQVALFNPKEYSLFIGVAVFSFEGIGLIIPITEAMAEPHKFPAVLSGVMVGISVLFASAGALSYATYGKDIQTVVISNLPQEHKFVQVVQVLYSLAIMLSTPLQLFPAVRIMENGLFSKSGKSNFRVKWQKNAFRSVTVLGCMFLAWAGSNDLDKFVAFVGCFACIPLCYIYPPMLHLRSGPLSRTAIVLDYVLIIFGCLVAVYTTIQTLQLLFGSTA